ncbi:MAG: hypothetical protein JXB18_03625, partial [Sedimentisphaerales bacterium]|nr:hypothetical protein [Sedimentisphaerales bacterium]
MEERNPNEVTTFPCAQKDREMKLRIVLFSVIMYVLFLAMVLFAEFSLGFIQGYKIESGPKIFVKPVFYTILFYFIIVRPGRIRHYTVDYQNAIIIDMGGSSEIISSAEVMGAEVLDRKRSFEFIQSSKLIVYQRDYKTKEHGTIKAYATNRDCFVLIKTRTVPNYII